MTSDERFERAIAAIDARNGDDPNTLTIHGVVRPKELAHAEMVSAWVRKLDPQASEPLLLAARAHHIRRWAIPRSDYAEGRVPYLQWRNALKDLHAAELRDILEREGYDGVSIGRTEYIVRKRDLTRDAEVQTLEDALCLTFLETQFDDLAAKHEEGKIVEVLRKTLRKMSARGIALALELELTPEGRRLLGLAAL